MRLDRPKIHSIQSFDFDWPVHHARFRDIPIYTLPLKDNPLIHIEIVFESGEITESRFLSAHFTAKMLLEGTKTKNNHQLSDQINYYGTACRIQTYEDYWSISVYTLPKHFYQMIDLLKEILCEAKFTETALELHKKLQKQELKEMLAQKDWLGHQKLREVLFGKQHHYGRMMKLKDINLVKLNDLQDYYQNRLKYNPQIFLIGNVEQKNINYLYRSIKKIQSAEYPPLIQQTINAKKSDNLDGKKRKRIHYKSHVQTCIVLGKKIPTKSHPDYKYLYITNTLLGGYFGSKLVQSLREKKGYTYHIVSYMISYKKEAYLYITTYVLQGYLEQVLEAIYQEIECIRKGKIMQQEIRQLQNYLQVYFMKTMNDFQQFMKVYQKNCLDQISHQYYIDLFQQLKHIELDQLTVTAEKYLKKEDFTEIIFA